MERPLLIAVNVFLFVSYAVSLTCYDCSSLLSSGDDCLFVDKDTQTETCSGSQQCQEYVTYLQEETVSTTRGCASSCTESESVTNGTGFITTCCDDKDDCNDEDYRVAEDEEEKDSATQISLSVLLTVMSVFLLMMTSLVN
ncbi:uncharacterized protein [Ptychodera flava]|uniref:uncharacterized protein n=1 Tax=Ptychodera flava TaxID=63121 RepID=UPI00396A9526